MKLAPAFIMSDLDDQNHLISRIRDLINNKNIEVGERLPSERILSEKFAVSRRRIRAALQKMAFYGVVNSVHQKGTFVANIGITAINGIIDDVLTIEHPDFKSLVETRILLELKVVALAAIHRTDDDLEQMERILDAHKQKVLNNEDALQEDLLFHLAIAKASRNATMNKLMLMITPEIISNFEKYHVCNVDMAFKSISEHEAILDAIKTQDASLARKKMKAHFKILYDFCYS